MTIYITPVPVSNMQKNVGEDGYFNPQKQIQKMSSDFKKKVFNQAKLLF